jgi:hypothetical protein
VSSDRTNKDENSLIGSIIVTNQFKFPNEALLLEDKRSNTIRLRSVEVSTLSISDGIPLNLFVKQTQRYKNYDDTGCHEAKHDEVKLTVKSESGQYLESMTYMKRL